MTGNRNAKGRDKFNLVSDEYLVEIQARAVRATLGPWKSYIERREEMSGSDFIMTQGDDIYLSGATKDDQDFIAYARTDVVNLLQYIKYLTERK